MLSIPVAPKTSLHKLEPRASESKAIERAQNIKMQELGIDPYEYDANRQYTEEEQELINEAIKLIILGKELPKELEEKVKEITSN